MSVLDKLTEGIVNRDLQKEGAALLEKWEKTGLLEGIDNSNAKQSMARLLENQARELLREASTMAGGNVEGFASVAFPIVRRVFGSLIANDLVSVQPMSLPSGLIFFLDFKFTNDRLQGREGQSTSLYGGGAVGQEITGGVNLSNQFAEQGPYSLNTGYSSTTGSATLAVLDIVLAAGVAGSSTGATGSSDHSTYFGGTKQFSLDELIQWDPDLSGSNVAVAIVPGDTELGQLSHDTLSTLSVAHTEGNASDTTSINTQVHRQVRRLTRMVPRSAAAATRNAAGLDPTDATTTSILLVFQTTGSDNSSAGLTNMTNDLLTGGQGSNKLLACTFATSDNFNNVTESDAGRGLGAIVGADVWGLEGTANDGEAGIPEIDIKIDSVAVTAQTKKLKAKWTPELGQDLNAYHNLDAEVELTSILSEQISLEIDREIITDLIKGATASTLHWSRRPGKFLNRETGEPLSDLANESLLGMDFTGTVSEWYETLVETINDVSANIHRKTLRGGANFIVVGPEVANILEFTAGFRANITHDSDKGTIGAVNTGSLSKKWDVYVDPYFPRNIVLVGRKGGSFLESGYVYAPYVPLQVTPTIFGVEDFVPRKGVMTRYAKKMVRPDMYGLVIVTDLLG